MEFTGRFDKQELAESRRTLSPNYAGTLAWMELTALEPWPWFVAFFDSLRVHLPGLGRSW